MFIRETALTYYNTIEKTIYTDNPFRGKLIVINPAFLLVVPECVFFVIRPFLKWSGKDGFFEW
jgi:hypothetical protein